MDFSRIKSFYRTDNPFKLIRSLLKKLLQIKLFFEKQSYIKTKMFRESCLFFIPQYTTQIISHTKTLNKKIIEYFVIVSWYIIKKDISFVAGQ